MKLNGIAWLLIVAGWMASSWAAADQTQFSGFTTKGNLSIWRIQHKNGAVSLCSYNGHINKPVCYPWSEGSEGKDFAIIPGDDALSTWRMNTETGAVSLCEYRKVTEPPICTPWSTD